MPHGAPEGVPAPESGGGFEAEQTGGGGRPVWRRVGAGPAGGPRRPPSRRRPRRRRRAPRPRGRRSDSQGREEMERVGDRAREERGAVSAGRVEIELGDVAQTAHPGPGDRRRTSDHRDRHGDEERRRVGREPRGSARFQACAIPRLERRREVPEPASAGREKQSGRVVRQERERSEDRKRDAPRRGTWAAAPAPASSTYATSAARSHARQSMYDSATPDSGIAVGERASASAPRTGTARFRQIFWRTRPKRKTAAVPAASEIERYENRE